MGQAKTAMVIGCGIGGPVVALALRRAGVEPVLYEARADPADEVGSFLNLASNGLRGLALLGVDRAVLAAGFPTPRMVLWSGTGKRLGEVANGASSPDGTVTLTIRRGLLHRALRDQVRRAGIALELGKRLVHAETHRGRALARFADGTEASADVLIGADGLHSRTRGLLAADAPAPRYTGQCSVGGIVPSSSVRPTPDEYHLVFGRRAFFGYSVRPSGEAYWFANLASAETEVTRSRQAWRRCLLEAFATDAGPARELIAATSDELSAYPIHDLPVVPTWHRGTLVLLGDAAHATSPSAGQGAAMAVEDAVVLARCLREAPDARQAFAAYEGRRRARVERVVKYSARIGSSKVAGPIGRVLRDLVMPLVLRRYAGSAAHAWLYQHQLEA
jgi:2-polyprenyl-6-methoxyphenol hydroxylase-like FAD-dependent oxidoreductase